jgi:hypothetical protein
MNNLNKVLNKEVSIKLILNFFNSLINEGLNNFDKKILNKILNKFNNYIHNEEYEIYYNYNTLIININNYIFKFSIINEIPWIYINNNSRFKFYDDIKINNVCNKFFMLIYYEINPINKLEKQKDKLLSQFIPITNYLINSKFKRAFDINNEILNCY